MSKGAEKIIPFCRRHSRLGSAVPAPREGHAEHDTGPPGKFHGPTHGAAGLSHGEAGEGAAALEEAQPGVLLTMLRRAGRPPHGVSPSPKCPGSATLLAKAAEPAAQRPPRGRVDHFRRGLGATMLPAPRRSSPIPLLSQPRSSFQARVLRPGQRGARPWGHTEAQIRVPHSLFLSFGDVLQPLIDLLSCHLRVPRLA